MASAREVCLESVKVGIRDGHWAREARTEIGRLYLPTRGGDRKAWAAGLPHLSLTLLHGSPVLGTEEKGLSRPDRVRPAHRSHGEIGSEQKHTRHTASLCAQTPPFFLAVVQLGLFPKLRPGLFQNEGSSVL